MTTPPAGCPFSSRRGFLAASAVLAGSMAAGLGTRMGVAAASTAAEPAATEPFHGRHQAGIVTPMQAHACFAAFDLVAERAGEVAALLQRWTAAAERMTAGAPAAPLGTDPSLPAGDSGEAIGLAPARLTLTFGFGPGLFTRDGRDRYGLAARRPAALVDLPRFNGDQLIATRSGGDLAVQACADDPQVTFHAIRQLARLANGTAQLRWAQEGFVALPAEGGTPRNLMGFRDGTNTPLLHPGDAERVLWVGDEGPAWMRGGSYLVARRIRIALEHWDRTDTAFQEQVIGRHKATGAPLGGRSEFDPLDLAAADADGAAMIPDDAHVRLAAAASNGGAQILRRSYSYNDGVNFTAERWPPWRQAIEFDAGLLFMAWQRDPRTGFIAIYQRMSRLDALNQFTTHTGGGLFACPGGVAPSAFVGQALFDVA